MKNKKVLLIMGLVLLLLILVVVLLLKLAPGRGVPKVKEELKVGTEYIPTLDSVAGDKGVADVTNSKDDTGTLQEIVYEDGVVSIDEINEYIRKLMKDDGFAVTKEAEIDENGCQTYQMGKQAEQENKVILVDFQFETGGSVRVSYRLADGPLETVD